MLRRYLASALIALAIPTLVSCASSDESPPSDTAASPTASLVPAAQDAGDTDAPTSTTTTSATGSRFNETAEEAFRSWLTASREPATDVACDYLADELVEKMLTQMRERGYPPVSGCAELTTMTAELYRSLGVSADVVIDVVHETHTTAELFVTYVDSGECGTVAMRRTTSGWLITEQSEECAQ